MAETNPKLWAQIEKREPNVYMTLLYWDSELYKRNTRRRVKNEGQDDKDYKEIVRKMLLKNWLSAALEGASETIGQGINGPAGEPYTVTARSGLCVRTGPAKTYTRLAVLSCGATVSVKGWENGWAVVDYNGSTAYMYGGFLSQKGQETQGEATGAYSALSISAVITSINRHGDGKDSVLDCGEFELDSLRWQSAETAVTIKGTALPFTSEIRQTKKSRVWEAYHLSGIANEMAAANGMTCMFETAEDPFYERVEQYKDSDISFLSTLCHRAGISLKATRRILVLYDQAAYESKSSVLTIAEGDGSYDKADLNIGTAETKYESCRVRYVDPATGECIEGVAFSEGRVEPNEEGKGQRLEITAKVTTAAEAKTLAAKLLRMHNKYARTASFTMPGSPALCAGVTVELEDFGPWSGKSIIRQAVHTVSPSAGYTTKISLRRVLEGY